MFRFETANERWSWYKMSAKRRTVEIAHEHGLTPDEVARILFDAGIPIQRDMVDEFQANRAIRAFMSGSPITKPVSIQVSIEELANENDFDPEILEQRLMDFNVLADENGMVDKEEATSAIQRML